MSLGKKDFKLARKNKVLRKGTGRNRGKKKPKTKQAVHKKISKMHQSKKEQRAPNWDSAGR